MDVWQYIAREQMEIPSLYFAHEREVFNRKGIWMAKSDVTPLMDGEKIEEKVVRFRTIGDITCTGAILSEADNMEDIIQEVAAARQTERGGRSDDKRSDSAMEDRKKQGYF
jgi:sulfate adenylyltransferase subunit 2